MIRKKGWARLSLWRYMRVVVIKHNPEALAILPADRWYQVNTAGQAQSGLWAPLLLGSGRSRRSRKYRSDQSARIPRGWSEKRNRRAKDHSAHIR